MIVLLAVAPGPVFAQSAPTAQAQPRPLTQGDALTLALQQNQSLRVAAFDVSVARAQLAQARAGAAIVGTVSAGYTRTQEQDPIVIPGFPPLPPPSPNIYDSRVVLQYPLSSGGRIEAQLAMAEANLKGAEATFERIKQEITFGVRQAYFSLLLAQGMVDSAGRSVAQAAESLRVARARVAAGVSPRFDEVQADVALATARQAQVRARNGVAQASQALAALLNLPIDTPLAPKDSFASAPIQTPLDRLIAQALLTRPELRELQARQAAAQAGIQLAESGGRLALGLSGVVSYSNTSGFIPGTDLSSLWSVTLAATWNVADGGLTKERINEAKLRLEQVNAAEAQQRQAIELDVRSAFLNLQSAREELAVADALLAQAAEALRLANVRFAAGVGTSLEVLSAQASISQAEAARAQSQYSYSVARAALERAVGAEVQ